MSQLAENAKSIFLQAVEIEPAERERFLNGACDNAEIRQLVEGLLGAHEEKDSLFDKPSQTSALETPPKLDQWVGTYKLLQKLGEGGMGIVYLAERQKPIKQRVALKIIKHGLDSQSFVARFEAERQALAIMDHPNIAKVLDAGCTEAGRPFFVMELVKGIPISDFCDENRLTTRDRLELFLEVCQAVHHAHQKGIIHRDIKPSNVLVALYDDKPVPKVIDFGVAKATNQQLTEKTLFTEVGSILGTWEYMSPEQAVLNQLDVDTRTDVYSLGVLLYELLTGETPLDRKRLRNAQLMETLRMIREEEPPKPSTRVSRSGDRATATAAYRSSKPHALVSEIEGDLDWIVMKALAKERSRRYDSANRLGEEIRRLLNNEAIEARPPSTLYQLRKFTERNRLLVTSVVAIVIGLTIAVIGVSMGWVRANRSAVQLQHARASLEDALVQGAFTEILSGHDAAAKDVIADVEAAGVAQARIDILSALTKMSAGEERQAIELLRTVVDDDRTSVEGWSMLAIAYEATGDLLPKFAAMRELDDLEAVSPVEELFAAWAQVGHGHRRQPVARLRGILDVRPSWSVARLILAQSLSREAINGQNFQLALEAFDHLERSKITFGDNPFAWSIELEVLTTLIRLSPSEHDTTAWRERAEDIARRLNDDWPNYVFGIMSRVWYYTCLGETDEAIAGWRQAIEHGAGKRAEATYLAMLIRERRFQDAYKSGGSGSYSAYFFAGDLPEALRRCKAIDDRDVLNRLWAQQCRYHCGEPEEALAEWRTMLESSRTMPTSVSRPLRLFAGDAKPSVILEEVAESGASDRSHALFCIGCYYLMQDDSEKALEYFQQGVDENAFMNATHYWSLLYVEQLENGLWPTSILGETQEESRTP